MAWDVDISLIKDWLDEQDARLVSDVAEAIVLLKREGPNLGRPLVDRIKGARYHHLKELRPMTYPGSEVRILFIFDPHRVAVMLDAGDKSQGKSNAAKWSKWYRHHVPIAERRYESYLENRGGH